MYRLEVGNAKYKYLASPHVIAIITPTRKTRIFKLAEVQSNPSLRVQNGTSDARIAPEEVAIFILKNRHKYRLW